MVYDTNGHKSGCIDSENTETGDIVRYNGQRWRVARTTDDYVEIYRRSESPVIVGVEAVEPVPRPDDADQRLVTDGGRSRKVVVHCDYCTAGMSVKRDERKPDDGWKCKQCWEAEQSVDLQSVADKIEDADAGPGDRVGYDGQEWVFVDYCIEHYATLVPVGLVASEDTVRRMVDVRELEPVETDDNDPYNSYDPVTDGRDETRLVTDGGVDMPEDGSDGEDDDDLAGELEDISEDWTEVDTSHLDEPEDGRVDLFTLGKPECPVCGKTCNTERGVKSHFGQKHKDKDWSDHADGDDDGIVSDGGAEAETDGGQILGEGQEFATPDDDGGESLDDRAAAREQSMKTVADLWDDARRAYEMASVNGADVTRRDALSVAIGALEAETEWMSISERSDQDYQDLRRWVEGDGWKDDAHEHIGKRLDDELDTDGDQGTAKKAVYHLAMRNKVAQNTLNAADYEDTLIPVGNGVINIDEIEYDADSMTIDWSSVELQEMKPKHRFIYRIDAEWDPENADLAGLDEWVDDIVLREDGKRVLWEMAGHSLHPHYPTDAFLVLLGKGGSGKSQWLSVVKKMIRGDEDKSDAVTTLSISDIESNRFTGYHLVDARANINTELSGNKLKSIDRIKTLSAGEEIYAEDKKKTGFFDDSDATMMFASDNPPAFPDNNRNDAVKRRLYPVEFPCQFVPNPDPSNPFELQHRPKMEVEAELQQDDRVLAALMRAIEGLTRLLNEGDITTGLSRDERLETYESFADPGRDFLRHCIEDAGPDSEIESGVLKATVNAFADAKNHDGRSLQQLVGVLEKSSSVSFAKHRTRSWSDEQSMHSVYSGIRFSADALRDFVPDHAKDKLDLSAIHEAEEDDTEPTAIDDHDDSDDDDDDGDAGAGETVNDDADTDTRDSAGNEDGASTSESDETEQDAVRADGGSSEGNTAMIDRAVREHADAVDGDAALAGQVSTVTKCNDLDEIKARIRAFRDEDESDDEVDPDEVLSELQARADDNRRVATSELQEIADELGTNKTRVNTAIDNLTAKGKAFKATEHAVEINGGEE